MVDDQRRSKVIFTVKRVRFSALLMEKVSCERLRAFTNDDRMAHAYPVRIIIVRTQVARSREQIHALSNLSFGSAFDSRFQPISRIMMTIKGDRVVVLLSRA